MLLVDNTAPELTVPAGFTIECDQEIVYDNVTATDACAVPEISVEVDTIPGFDACPNTFTIVHLKPQTIVWRNLRSRSLMCKTTPHQR